ncbi:aspartyl/glutamyl-tRNA amidotransferase subunit A [[Clostridium] sordellii]|uniref:amidase family protein n=1 Tax=Paraclostridium sordellii TaxID=1505 RepID=UPI000542AF78|nr:amidase family protein [Paeniclostridium sordellii]CEK29968.1 aspartyl/glutamyl-tRNA amidotransferase subunit A [[Clostridium] sordellii] [Paeniclostridium sordellii]
MKKSKIAIIAVIALAVATVGGFMYIKQIAPSGEEWISYNNQEVINLIDNQLKEIDIDKISKEKERYVIEKSIDEIQSYVKSGKITYSDITAICLNRIKDLDQKEHGLNSVVTVNPDAIEEARNADKASSDKKVGVFGIPVLLKDNINTANIPTSSGAEAFTNFIPSKDAELVENLRENGAVILGKNNLSEFANYMSTRMPSGYSGSKGQTVNPFGPLKISPSGSSSGSAVSVTANLAPISIGTETSSSIIAPSYINSVVGFKPSRTSVSSKGIMPLVKKFDTPGPISKTVEDAVIGYNSMSNNKINIDKNSDYLKGKTIALLSYEYNDQEMLDKIKSKLKDIGVNLVEINIDETGTDLFGILDISFKKDFEEFAAKYNLPIKKLNELIEYNKKDLKRRAKYGQDHLEASASIKDIDQNVVDNAIKNDTKKLDEAFKKYNLDAIVCLNNSGIGLSSIAGYPELTIHFGKNAKNEPQGVTFITKNGEDKKILDIGYSFESQTHGRINPLSNK